MHHLEFPPPVPLRDTIRCFWYNTRDFGRHPSAFEILPDGYAEIIFYFGRPCSISWNGDFQLLPSPFLMGLLDQPVRLHTQGRQRILGIRCFPWTVFDLLGLPSRKDKVHIFQHPIARLQSGLRTSIDNADIPAAINLVQQYFLDAQAHLPADSMLFKAGVAMGKAKGAMPVGEVAAAAHATVRTLERKFKRSSGYTVKGVSALMRFEQVRNRLWLEPTVNLAGLAHELGYTDQSHLSREFRKFSGTTPGAFARKAKKGQQSVSSDFVAFVQD